MKKITFLIFAAVLVLPAAAQDSGTALHPEFGADVSFSSVYFNIDENETVKEIPGL